MRDHTVIRKGGSIKWPQIVDGCGWCGMGGGEVPKMKCRYSQFFTCHLQKRLVHTVVTPFLHSDKDLLLAE